MSKTVSFETAKKLWEMGIKVESEQMLNYTPNRPLSIAFDWVGNDTIYIPLPDAQELLDRMPAEIKHNGITYLLTLVKTFDNRINNKHYSASYHCFYCDEEWEESEHTHINNPSEALAEMLMWLVNNGYVTVEEINGGK